MSKTCAFCKTATTKPCMTEAGTIGCRLKQRHDKNLVEELALNVRFMRNTDNWPRWPVLPLKIPGNVMRPGFLVTGKGPIVHVGSMYQIEPGQRWDEFSREMYESYEAIFAAGWRVD